LDTPKTDQSVRKVALTDGLVQELQAWKKKSVCSSAEAFVFPSEKMTPMRKHNVWLRNMRSNLKTVGLEWCTFQVMRRTFVTLSKANGGDAKTIADQCGHYVGVSLREYAQTPLESKLALVNQLEKLVG